MADFSSALYLGMRHPSSALGSWDALTLGRPAALQEPPDGQGLASALARLQGCEAATLLTSTLHLFWDLFGMLCEEPLAILQDAAAYPIARWGAQRALAQGAVLQVFAPGAVRRAQQLAQYWRGQGRCPVILADGYTPGSAAPPPLAAYARIAREYGGYLVLDDTQALGLLGSRPDRYAPYGRGGGGSLPWHGLAGPHVVVGASLAKAFGAPLAVLAGGRQLVRRFEQQSQVRSHTSPPCAAVIRAGLHALELNRQHGDALRWQLWCRVAQWGGALARDGRASEGGIFPVQTLCSGPGVDAAALHERLRQVGIDAVLQQHPARLSFLLRADHSAAEIDRLLGELSAALAQHSRRQYAHI